MKMKIRKNLHKIKNSLFTITHDCDMMMVYILDRRRLAFSPAKEAFCNLNN